MKRLPPKAARTFAYTIDGVIWHASLDSVRVPGEYASKEAAEMAIVIERNRRKHEVEQQALALFNTLK